MSGITSPYWQYDVARVHRNPSFLVLFNFRRNVVVPALQSSRTFDGVAHYGKVIDDARNYGVTRITIPKYVVIKTGIDVYLNNMKHVIRL